MFEHQHREVQASVGELQELQLRCHCYCRYSRLAVVRSHYPAIDLQAIGAGFAEGMGEAEHQQLEDEVEDAAKKLAGDIDLFGKTDGDGKAR